MEPGERIKKSFGARLRKIREGSAVSVEALAERLGVHPNTVYKLERGEQWVGADVLEAIETSLPVDLSRLFTDCEPRPTPHEALAVLARAIEAPKHDPLAARVARLTDPAERKAIEEALDAYEGKLPAASQLGEDEGEHGHDSEKEPD